MADNIPLTKQELSEAIKQGVKEAFLEAMNSGVRFDGWTIRECILESIKDGTESAINWNMPCKMDLKDIYYDAVHAANLK